MKINFLKKNPIFTMMLGLCSALSITTTFENAFIMGLNVTIILMISNMLVSMLRKLIPSKIQIPAYILIISTLVTLIEIFLQRYLPKVSNSLGIYIPLIIVNCLILGRALSFASKNKIWPSIKDGFMVGIKYSGSLLIIASIREILGHGTLTLINNLSPLFNQTIILKLPNIIIFPNNFFVSPAGAFLVLGILLAFFNWWEDRHETN